MNIQSLTALATLAHASLSIAEGLGAAAPALAKGAPAVLSSGKVVLTDLGTIVADLKAGKYADEPADIQRAMTDVVAAIHAVEAEAEPIAALAGSSTSLPSLSGISAILSKL